MHIRAQAPILIITQPIYPFCMKKIILSILLSFFVVMISQQACAQNINSVGYNPSPALACSTITVNTSGSLNCANMTIGSPTNTTAGTIISVRIDIMIGFICLPAIVPFSQSHILTNVNPGTYRLTVNTFLNNTFSDSMSTTIVIGACCQVNTNFNLTNTAICPGDSVTFTSINTALLNYGWKIDGSPLQNSVTVGNRFAQAGTYQVRLVGNDSTCLDSTEKIVRVASFPIIGFTSSVMENCPGSMDGAIGTSVSGGIGNYSYNWSTGDTISGLSQISGGTYIITVADSVGCASTDTVIISTGPAVVASYIPSKTTQICPGETLNFTNSGVSGTSFVWKKDGQQFSQSTDAFYTFNDTGSFTISLNADDGPACADSFSMTFIVSGPTADFMSSAPNRACPDEEIMLTNTSLAASIYSWTSSGIPFSSATNATISFTQQNSYDITLIASDGSCSDTTTIGVNITAPSASFSASKMSPICPGEFATLTNTSTNNIGNWWSANGMQFSMNGNAVYTFNDPGMIDIKLVIRDDRCFDSTSMTFTVNALPTVIADVQDVTCEGDENGSIDLTVSGGVPPFLYDWSNGAAVKDLNKLLAGMYDIIIRDPDGCEWTDSYVINTKGGLSADYSTLQKATGVQFTDKSDTTATSWSWDFGDGNTSTSQSPLHSYAFNGKYIVCLVARDRFGCTDTLCDTLDVATSIWEAFDASLHFYPNPTEDAIYLDLSSLRGKQVTIRLHDQLGREVKMLSLIAAEETRVELTQLPKAVYILSVESRSGKLVAKVVKN